MSKNDFRVVVRNGYLNLYMMDHVFSATLEYGQERALDLLAREIGDWVVKTKVKPSLAYLKPINKQLYTTVAVMSDGTLKEIDDD